MKTILYLFFTIILFPFCIYSLNARDSKFIVKGSGFAALEGKKIYLWKIEDMISLEGPPLDSAVVVNGRVEFRGDEATPEDSLSYQIDEEHNRLVALEHEKAWKEARWLRETITDADFLQTKRPMSDDAIGPYNYHTGFIEDRAYNQTILVIALERAKKHLSVSKEKLILNLHSGQEINIAEDLFEFITMLIDEWNGFIEDGLFRIIQTEDGYYDIAPNRNSEKE